MKNLRITPVHHLWLAFVLLLSIAVSLGWFSHSLRTGASLLSDRQTEMTNRSDRARARMEKETDIAKLRHWALMTHDGAKRDWDLVVFTNGSFARGLRSFSCVSILPTILVGFAIYGLSRRTPHGPAANDEDSATRV